MKQKVFVTREIPSKGIDILKKNFEVKIFEKRRPIKKEELIQGAKNADGLLCLLTDEIDKKVIEKTNIKAIANYAVGYDNIDVKEATKRGIPVTNTPGVLTDATADLTWALILSVGRRIVEADQFVRAENFNGWDPMLFLGADYAGKKLGIIGFGRIGKAVAKRAQGFDMTILYYNRTRKKELEEELNAIFVPLEQLMKESDFISLHCPYTKETHHLIDKKELNLMKKEAYLINTARGQVVNEKELIKALQEGKLAGAGLDVYYNEPDLNNELLELDNVVLLPHIGSASRDARTKMSIIAATNLTDALKDKKPENIINPEIFD